MSRLFAQLGFEGFALATAETIYMTLISTVVAYAIGLPLGILLCATDKGGIKPNPWLNKIVGVIVNILRSIPFVILMVALIPASRAIIGTSIGNNAMIFMLVVAAAPYIARMVESSVKEVDKGVIEAARSMGANTWQIIFKVYLPEAKPSLIVGAVISTVTIIGYSAMAGDIAGGGLGALAVTHARPSNAQDVIWLCIAISVVLVQLVQELGMLLAKRLDKRLYFGKRKRKAAQIPQDTQPAAECEAQTNEELPSLAAADINIKNSKQEEAPQIK